MLYKMKFTAPILAGEYITYLAAKSAQESKESKESLCDIRFDCDCSKEENENRWHKMLKLAQYEYCTELAHRLRARFYYFRSFSPDMLTWVLRKMVPMHTNAVKLAFARLVNGLSSQETLRWTYLRDSEIERSSMFNPNDLGDFRFSPSDEKEIKVRESDTLEFLKSTRMIHWSS